MFKTINDVLVTVLLTVVFNLEYVVNTLGMKLIWMQNEIYSCCVKIQSLNKHNFESIYNIIIQDIRKTSSKYRPQYMHNFKKF